MLRKLHARVTYANVISTLCLFMLLGGGAYAATSLPKDSVGTKQLKADAVTSAKVKDHALVAKDVKAGQLLPFGGTAANARKVGGIAPTGFVHGHGTTVSASFNDTTRNLTPFVALPGGASIQLGCGASGYFTSFAPANTGSRKFDVFETELVTGGGPTVTYHEYGSGDIVLALTRTDDRQFTWDVSSDAGHATVTEWAHFDGSTKKCFVRADGMRSP